MTIRSVRCAAVVAAVILQCPAMAQSPSDAMAGYELTTPGVYQEPAVALWKDLLDKANREVDSNPAIRPMNYERQPPGQHVNGKVHAREFRAGDTTILASIYDAFGSSCDSGPNTSRSTQTWSTNCPIRVKVSNGTNSHVVQDVGCSTYGNVYDTKKPPLTDRNYAVYDASLNAVTFSVTSQGKVVNECTKTILLGVATPKIASSNSEPSASAEFGSPIASAKAHYSDTSGKTCKQHRSHSEYSEWSCSAPAGRRVLFGDTGAMFGVQFGKENNTELEPMFHPAGDAIGKKIEWRLQDGKPYAAILRVNVAQDLGKAQQVLVVTKIDGDVACHLGHVDARLKNANARAAELADSKARSFRCGSDQPIKVGNPPSFMQ